MQKTNYKNGKISYCQLTKVRKVIPPEIYKTSHDYDWINFNLLNNYINKYA